LTVPVTVVSYLRGKRGVFTNIRDVKRYVGDRTYVEGAVEITIDGYELMTHRHWDDVDMLWALLVQAVEACRTTGAGETYFPDQPLLFRVERRPAGRLLVALGIGDDRRAKSADAEEFYRALAAAGVEFFHWHRRLVKGSDGYPSENALLRSWLRR
jgi:hypothetical protein